MLFLLPRLHHEPYCQAADRMMLLAGRRIWQQ